VDWRVEILNEVVAAEITALPADMQARFLRLAERITSVGLESLGGPHVKHLEGKGVAVDGPGRNCSCTLRHGNWPKDGCGSRVRQKDAKDSALRDRARPAASTGGHMTIPFEKLKSRLLANPKVKAEYDALAPEFEIAAELLRARLRAGLSQAELAARMGTSQSTIARLESGQTLPSTKTLLRYAEATGSKFHVRLSAA
jgi:ribosome-binding protein aMBF1 (putative translation factor)